MKLDFLIPASPTPAFFSQIAFFRLSLDALGGAYRDARLVAVFGDDKVSALPADWAWAPHFRNIEVAWVAKEIFTTSGYAAQSDRRYELLRDDADLAVLCDADVAPMARFDPLTRALRDRPALAGVIAHKHFPWPGRGRDPDIDWPEIAISIIGQPIERRHRYTLLDQEARATAPFYINHGVVMAPPALLKMFYRRNRKIRPRVADIVGHWWAPQVSLPLTCAEYSLPTMELPIRYNYPNDPVADDAYPAELNSIIFLHYLRLRHFDRQKIFASESSFESFLKLDLTGSNLRFQEHVMRVTEGLYPFRT